MVKYFYWLIYSLVLNTSFGYDPAIAQVNYEGQVIDKNSEIGIPVVTLRLSNIQKIISTNEHGYFSFHVSSANKKDSLIFSSVGYKTYYLSVSSYKRGMFISLEPTAIKLEEVVISKRKKIKILGGFSSSDLDPLKLKFGNDYPKSIQGAHMYAKLFSAPSENSEVTSISLGRWQPDEDSWVNRPGKTSKFKIHIMTVNPTSGAPNKILSTKEIAMNDRSRKLTIKIDTGNVIQDNNKFFIVVEWLREPYNEYILQNHYIVTNPLAKGLNKVKRNEGFDRVIYQPLLAQYLRTPKAPCWLLTNGVWEFYDRSPYEIALSTTIKY